jgi:hypothetical protein
LVDAGEGTHLSTSLKELQKLNIDAVSVMGDGLTVDLGGDLAGLGLSDLPQFTNQANVTLNLGSLGINGDSELLNAQQFGLLSELQEKGIDQLAIEEALGSDWLDLDTISAIYSQDNLGFKLGLDSQLKDFDLALAGLLGTKDPNATDSVSSDLRNGIDLLSGFTTSETYGELVQALTASGVSDFVVDRGDVQITDNLAAALVDAGMLQALPEANLVIDATKSIAENAQYAHLFTSLKAISELGVDAIEVGGVNKVYIDLGLPADDSTAMADIQAILGAIDPANQAKLVHAGAAQKDFSLVMSGDLAKAIIDAGGFNATDVANMAKLGINEITLLDSLNTMNSAQGLFKVPVSVENLPQAQTPQVTILGSAGPDAQLFDDLDIKKPLGT